MKLRTTLASNLSKWSIKLLISKQDIELKMRKTLGFVNPKTDTWVALVVVDNMGRNC